MEAEYVHGKRGEELKKVDRRVRDRQMEKTMRVMGCTQFSWCLEALFRMNDEFIQNIAGTPTYDKIFDRLTPSQSLGDMEYGHENMQYLRKSGSE